MIQHTVNHGTNTYTAGRVHLSQQTEGPTQAF